MHKSNILLTNGKDGKVFKMEKGSSLTDSNHSFSESYMSGTNQGVLSRSTNDDGRSGQVPQQQQQQLFNNFYDKVRDMNSSIGFNSRNENMMINGNGGNSNLAGYYYDEYDSNSDEEISVT